MNPLHAPHTRRHFLKTVLGGLAVGGPFIASAQQSAATGLPTRVLGKTGERVSIIGLGGWTIGGPPEKEAITIMHEAIDQGLHFFENCWEYRDGKSEEVMGKALATSGRRDKVFLMTKACGRDEASATRHLEESLRRLQTDRVDLWMFHGIKRDSDADMIFGMEGAIHAALRARKEGKIRYIGFTGHQDPSFHLRMLGQDFDWDAVLMPLNILDAHYNSFQTRVLPVLNERGIGVLGMKALSVGRIPNDLGVDASLCRRYALSLPITSLMCGIESRRDLQQDISLARDFQPLTQLEVDELLAVSYAPSKDGQYERYKTGNSGCDWHVEHLG